MSCDPALPALTEGQLGPDELDRYAQDLRALCRVLAVVPKRSQRGNAGGGVDLEQGLSLLRSGDLRALQIRYLHAGREWWDTLIQDASAIRLVRIDQGASPDACSA